MLQLLLGTGGPVDDDSVDPIAPTDAEMEPPIVLACEAHAAIHDPSLRDAARLDDHLRADGASIAPRTDELEPNPVIRGVRRVAVQHPRLPLVRHDHVHCSTLQPLPARA